MTDIVLRAREHEDDNMSPVTDLLLEDMADEVERLQGLLAAEQRHYREQAAECLEEKHRADKAEDEIERLREQAEYWKVIAREDRAEIERLRERVVNYELTVQRGIKAPKIAENGL